MNELYIVGCFVSLGFYLVLYSVNKTKELSDFIAYVFVGIILYFLSWVGVIYFIIREIKNKDKKETNGNSKYKK